MAVTVLEIVTGTEREIADDSRCVAVHEDSISSGLFVRRDDGDTVVADWSDTEGRSGVGEFYVTSLRDLGPGALACVERVEITFEGDRESDAFWPLVRVVG